MLDKWNTLSEGQKDKVEFLCNECCWFGCRDRKACYEDVSRKNLGEDGEEHRCTAPNAKEGYRFSKAMTNPGFISVDDIKNIYLPMGFTNFKIEGRGLGSALILEFLLYYMTKPEYQLHVREEFRRHIRFCFCASIGGIFYVIKYCADPACWNVYELDLSGLKKIGRSAVMMCFVPASL